MDLADIINDTSDAVRAALQAAYDAGHAAGLKEASDELRGRMLAILDTSVLVKVATETPTLDSVIAMNPSGRAAPGSVKPTVERMLLDATGGLTAAEIADRAGFKFNSVRGTLWSLGKEGFAEQRDGRWYAVKKDEDPPSEADEGPALLVETN